MDDAVADLTGGLELDGANADEDEDDVGAQAMKRDVAAYYGRIKEEFHRNMHMRMTQHADAKGEKKMTGEMLTIVGLTMCCSILAKLNHDLRRLPGMVKAMARVATGYADPAMTAAAWRFLANTASACSCNASNMPV